MKFKFLIVALMVANITLSQSSQNSLLINSSNYYSYFKDEPGMTVNWLRQCDAVPTIIDELIKDSIPYYTISVGELLKINDSTRFVVTVAFNI